MTATAPQPHGFDEMHILWISEGMSCDGDTVSVTAASQPPIEDVVLGLVPGLPDGPPAQQCPVPDAWR
jgi:hydrogenase small subunit